MAQFLIANNTNGSVHRGKIKEATEIFGVSTRNFHYIWNEAKKQIDQGVAIMFKHKQLGVERDKRVLLDEEKFKSIPHKKRSTIRRVAKELGASKSQVGRWIKRGAIKPHTNAIKPQLTAENKFQRVRYSLNALVRDRNDNKIKFQSMYNVVHIDEKWFYMTKITTRSYKLPEEVAPYRACQSKRYIPKVMFMSVVARPQIASDGQVLFDGKIGLFPFTYIEPAARNSRNGVRGTMVTKPIASITKDVIKNCLVNQIIPAIKAKWPANASKTIYIQQDNARPHITNNDPAFRATASSDGFNIILVCQPPNSPETNINDLGFFRAIQSLQVDTDSYKVDELVTNVLDAFDKFTVISLNNVFLSLQSVLVEILKVKGHNNFQLPHMGKAKLLMQERLPETIEVDEDLVRECIQFLMENGQVQGLTFDTHGLRIEG